MCIYIYIYSIKLEDRRFWTERQQVCKNLRTSHAFTQYLKPRRSPIRWVARQAAVLLDTAIQRAWANPTTTHDHFRLTYRDCQTSAPVSPCRPVAINLSAKLEHIKAYSSHHYDFSGRCSRTHNALCCCSHHSCAKNKTFSLWILHAKEVKSFSFPLHGSCSDATDQSLTFLELSIFSG